MYDVKAVAEVLGGRAVLGREVGTIRELGKLLEEGLPVEALRRATLRVTGDEQSGLALSYEIVPRTTLERRRRLTHVESERVERVARIAALAERVWEEPELAHEFLASEQPGLEGARPVDLALTELGIKQVEELLMKLEHGLPV